MILKTHYINILYMTFIIYDIKLQPIYYLKLYLLTFNLKFKVSHSVFILWCTGLVYRHPSAVLSFLCAHQQMTGNFVQRTHYQMPGHLSQQLGHWANLFLSFYMTHDLHNQFCTFRKYSFNICHGQDTGQGLKDHQGLWKILLLGVLESKIIIFTIFSMK